MSKQDKGPKIFNQYYQDIYRARWTQLSEAMKSSSNYIQLFAKSLNNDDSIAYHVDNASFITSSIAYRIITQHRCSKVLDMCSAPGGKLLGILQHYKENPFDFPCSIVANERSRNRFFRLKRNLDKYYYASTEQLHITTTCKDGNLYGKHQSEVFDFVLLDAPCSNDAHVMHNHTQMQQWSPRRCIRLTHIQTSLLCAAIDTCKPNCHVFYLTCSINPLENEEIITRVLKKRKVITVDIKEYALKTSYEQYKHGGIILPDVSQGAGPLYMCILKKE